MKKFLKYDKKLKSDILTIMLNVNKLHTSINRHFSDYKTVFKSCLLSEINLKYKDT